MALPSYFSTLFIDNNNNLKKKKKKTSCVILFSPISWIIMDILGSVQHFVKVVIGFLLNCYHLDWPFSSSGVLRWTGTLLLCEILVITATKLKHWSVFSPKTMVLS